MCLIASAAAAQRNELAITGGGYVPAGIQTDVHFSPVIEGSFAHRVFSVPLASVYVELPVARTFDVGLNAIQGNYTATFVTPGLKLKLAPGFPASPFFVAGIGVAHFSASGALTGSSSSKDSTSVAVDVGGGLDIKVFPFVSLRGEVRNINSGGLGFAVPLVSGRQNNVLVTGGIVLRF
ncbi:MAG TPA: hypothetical protein VFM10_13760 [Terriglobales bacterium]|nr:hypothetical protein [Terriglobales bacterium]